MSDPIIELAGLSVEVAQTRLLHDVSFTQARGDVLCIISESGAGKSTLLTAFHG